MINSLPFYKFPEVIFFSLADPAASVLAMLGEISSKSLGLWAGLGTAAVLGYCIYFDR